MRVTILLELDPVPGDVAIAVRTHVATAASDRSKLFGTSMSTSSVDTLLPRSIRTMTFSGSSATCFETTARISSRRRPNRSGCPRNPRSCARRICSRSRATGPTGYRGAETARGSCSRRPPSQQSVHQSAAIDPEPPSSPSRPLRRRAASI